MTDAPDRPDTVHALLADGSTVEIRPARPQDRDEVLRMHREMSPGATRLRFFAVNGGTATELLADHAARLAPLTDRDAHSLLTAPRSAPRLPGRRARGPGGSGTDAAEAVPDGL